MNTIKRFLNSVSSMAVVLFIIGSFGVLLGGMTMPLITYVGWGMLAVVLVIIIYNFFKLTKLEKNAIKNDVKHTVKDEAYFKQLGELRTSVKSNKVKVMVVAILHSMALIYAVGFMALFVAKKNGEFGAEVIALLIIALFFGLLPLRHLGDYVEYYSHGFVYCGYVYLYQKVGGIRFTGINGGSTLTGVWLRVNGDTMDGSYLKEAKQTYFGTYYKRALDPSQSA